MKKYILLGFVGLAAVIALAIVFAILTSPPAVVGNVHQAISNSASTSTNKQLFADSPYKPYAYLISTDTVDTATQQALSGFKLVKQNNADGSQTISLKALESRYADQTYVVKPGEKLYFIETSLSDDPANRELSLSDDTAILVNAQGYAVNQ